MNEIIPIVAKRVGMTSGNKLYISNGEIKITFDENREPQKNKEYMIEVHNSRIWNGKKFYNGIAPKDGSKKLINDKGLQDRIEELEKRIKILEKIIGGKNEEKIKSWEPSKQEEIREEILRKESRDEELTQEEEEMKLKMMLTAENDEDDDVFGLLDQQPNNDDDEDDD